MTALDIVITKLHNKVDELTCQVAIEEVEQAIKNYCNIDKIPNELRFVTANMAVDLIRYEQAIVGENPEGLDEISLSDVASVKIGDTSVSFGKGAESATVDKAKESHNANLDAIVMNYGQQLRSFRRLVW